MTEELAREKFEAWARGFRGVFPLDKDPSGDYLSVLTGNVWIMTENAYRLGQGAASEIKAQSIAQAARQIADMDLTGKLNRLTNEQFREKIEAILKDTVGR